MVGSKAGTSVGVEAESLFRKLECTGSLYPDASQFNGKVAGKRVQSGVQQTAARRRRLVSSSAYRRASSRLVAGHNNRVSNSGSFGNKRVVCCRYGPTLLYIFLSSSLSSLSLLLSPRRDKQARLTIKTNRFVPRHAQISRSNRSSRLFLRFHLPISLSLSLFFLSAPRETAMREECRLMLESKRSPTPISRIYSAERVLPIPETRRRETRDISGSCPRSFSQICHFLPIVRGK